MTDGFIIATLVENILTSQEAAAHLANAGRRLDSGTLSGDWIVFHPAPWIVRGKRLAISSAF
jgi:hypothetical protein